MSPPQRKPILILGIGNVLMRDEGVGPHAIGCLARADLPPGVDLLDGGTSGADLVDEIADRDLVLVVDAALGGDPPGSITRCQAEDLLAETDAPLSLHEFGLVETLRLARLLDCTPRRTVVFGVQPAEVSLGLGLSATVERQVPELVRLVLAEARAASAPQPGIAALPLAPAPDPDPKA